MVLSFMMRCTSPIGYVLLVFYKLISEKALVAFVLAGVLVAIPTFLVLFALDSYCYG
jgi:hypothetical protein